MLGNVVESFDLSSWLALVFGISRDTFPLAFELANVFVVVALLRRWTEFRDLARVTDGTVGEIDGTSGIISNIPISDTGDVDLSVRCDVTGTDDDVTEADDVTLGDVTVFTDVILTVVTDITVAGITGFVCGTTVFDNKGVGVVSAITFVVVVEALGAAALVAVPDVGKIVASVVEIATDEVVTNVPAFVFDALIEAMEDCAVEGASIPDTVVLDFAATDSTPFAPSDDKIPVPAIGSTIDDVTIAVPALGPAADDVIVPVAAIGPAVEVTVIVATNGSTADDITVAVAAIGSVPNDFTVVVIDPSADDVTEAAIGPAADDVTVAATGPTVDDGTVVMVVIGPLADVVAVALAAIGPAPDDVKVAVGFVGLATSTFFISL